MLGPIHTNPGISKNGAYFVTQIRVKGPYATLESGFKKKRFR